MKFAIATIFTLALALGVQCSVIGLGHHEIAGHGLAYTAVSGPLHGHVLAHAPHASIAVHAASPWAHGLHGAWHGDVLGHHGAVVVDHGHHAAHHAAVVVDHGHHGHHGAIVVDHGHHAAHHAAVVVDHGHHAAVHHGAHVIVAPHHEGSYVAKTRGAVHTAPLSGHISSAAAINVAPAPGTV